MTHFFASMAMAPDISQLTHMSDIMRVKLLALWGWFRLIFVIL